MEYGFSHLDVGSTFPTNSKRKIDKYYKMNKRLYTGEYCKNKRLIARVDEQYKEIDYRVLPLNYFKLMVDKIDSLLFGNELNITTGDIEKDKLVNKLVEKTGWRESIRLAIKDVEIYGDSIIKTSSCGASVVSPIWGYKVHDRDTNKQNAVVLYEYLYDQNDEEYVRILACGRGWEWERVYRYDNGKLGEPVRYKYNDRWIPKAGRFYNTWIDRSTVQWLSINKLSDDVYGHSSFDQVKPLIFALENRLSTENWVIDAHGKPLLIVGMSSVRTDETTGEYYLSVINGKYMINREGSANPEYLTWDGKLDASKQVRDDIMSAFYELSEMGRTFLSGEYQGNISEESLNNIIKSAIDRGNRELNEVWAQIRNSLYVLCRLNNIDVNIEDLNVDFNVGRADDTKVIADICEKLNKIGLFSKETLLSKFWGYSAEDAEAEFERIRLEGGVNNDNK